jgi:hypothetical protein
MAGLRPGHLFFCRDQSRRSVGAIDQNVTGVTAALDPQCKIRVCAVIGRPTGPGPAPTPGLARRPVAASFRVLYRVYLSS